MKNIGKLGRRILSILSAALQYYALPLCRDNSPRLLKIQSHQNNIAYDRFPLLFYYLVVLYTFHENDGHPRVGLGERRSGSIILFHFGRRYRIVITTVRPTVLKSHCAYYTYIYKCVCV